MRRSGKLSPLTSAKATELKHTASKGVPETSVNCPVLSFRYNLVTGSRDRVQRYIEILENVPYVARLVSVDLKSLSKTEWQSNVKIKVMLLSYDE